MITSLLPQVEFEAAIEIRLSIIVPCYNERGTISTLIKRVRAVTLPMEIIVIDDGSTDGSRDLLRELDGQIPDLTVLYHSVNRGKGAAVRTGLAAATGTIIIIQDADLEYDPQDYHALTAPMLHGEAQVVYGSRNLRANHYSSRTFYWGGRLVTLVTNLLYGARLTDEATCYKAFSREVLQGLRLEGDGFEFCPEVTAKILRSGYNIHEVPISYHARLRTEGKKIKMRDGLSAIWTLLKYRITPNTNRQGLPGKGINEGVRNDGFFWRPRVGNDVVSSQLSSLDI